MEDFDINQYPGLSEILISKSKDNIILHDPPRKVELLSHQMLRGTMREYVIEKIKKPIVKAIITLVGRLPTPTRGNTLNSNTHILFDIFDKFLEYEDNPGREQLFKALFKLIITEYEHDPYYRARINFLIEELVEATMDGKWLPRGKDRPIDCWKEPKPFGLYEGRRFKNKINREGEQCPI